jgi:heme/copper-type cytochrome/quinol oxidase subunit 1
MLFGISNDESTMDFNVHDTYFVVANIYVSFVISLFFGIIGIVYMTMQNAGRKLSKWMTWM